MGEKSSKNSKIYFINQILINDKTMKIKKISIVMPVYNEEQTLKDIIELIEKVDFGEIEKELIMVDDGSTDSSKSILNTYKDKHKIFFHDENKGKGSAIRTGFENATGDYVIIQDADLEYDPDDIKKLIDKAEKDGSKVVYGSRILGINKGKTSNQFFYFGGRLLSFLTNILYGTKITDEPTCYKMFHKEVVGKMKIESKRFEFCPEVTAKSLKLGYNIEEVPISYNPRSKEQGKHIKLFKDGSMAIWTLIKYRFDRDFFKQNRFWIFIILSFILVRVLVFSTFWNAVVDRGGWNVFYGYAQPAKSVLKVLFHDFCDWHPPLYYTFTSVILFLFKSQWVIYILQNILAFITTILCYKISRLYFNKNLALTVALLVSIEPFWAWHNFMLVSGNLSTPILLFGLYFLFKYLKEPKLKYILFSAFSLGISTLVRPNTLIMMPAVCFLIFIIYLLFSNKKWNIVKELPIKKLFVHLIIYLSLFFILIFPWMLRNKMVYGNYILANILSTNIYYYNLAPLRSVQENVSYTEAKKYFIEKANADLVNHVEDQGDCTQFTKEELQTQFDYYSRESKKYIFENFGEYLKMHLIRAVPFFLQPGYFQMWSQYTGDATKPDVTGLLLRGELSGIVKFIKEINLKTFVYFSGMAFWGVCSLSLVIATIYSFIKDRERFVFFLLSLAIICYNALIISPFILARYRLSYYVFFFIPFIYILSIIFKKNAKKN